MKLATLLAACTAFLLTLQVSRAQITANDGDWSQPLVTLNNTPEAVLMVRTGDIDNLGYGWPGGFNPFTGATSPTHGFPFQPGVIDPVGTDRIMVPTSYLYGGHIGYDGYAQSTSRPGNAVQTIALNYQLNGVVPGNAALQLFVDDFQPVPFNGQWQVTMNGTRAPFLEAVINTLNQTGPVGKLLTVNVPPSFLPAVATGHLELRFDDVTTGEGDGYAVDFVKLLINRTAVALTGSVSGSVRNAANNAPLSGATVAAGSVSTTTNAQGQYTLSGVFAGLATVRAVAPGFRTATRQVDVVQNQTTGGVDFALQPGSLDVTARAATEISFPGTAGALYVLQWSTDATTWHDDESVAGTGTVVKFYRPHDTQRRLWRIEER